MNIAENLKKIREQKGLQQKQVALDIGIGTTNYNRIENGQREASVEVLDKLSKFYGITIDEIVNFEDKKLPPKEVAVQDKAILEQVELIQELEPDEKSMVFKMIDTFINQKKFKDFVKQNVAL
ncbi:transcriptional regulator with XRE-family HTH domain [Chryseobacterium sp. H1D6B]|uniref:helix-turn-helix domain-containing protein n=1 Tax=Chryseobacterium sp. H1D6B TaxID=2940588 RepID=UPI0015C6A354|nr:helix-turn-helix transcriptional regulator [Chryseobacterium sp. H1D6B]MDH6254483.1 transcriptional regulator with XRE-family HTH domain [Chryseobacterium sp. H1D6B]